MAGRPRPLPRRRRPDQVGFQTKPELARVMLERALEAGVPAGWVTADAVYGGSPALRGWLEARRLPFVLAVKCTEPLPPTCGPSAPAARLAERIRPECWLRLSAGQGAKGRRWYAWSRLALSTADVPDGWQRWLLVRRSLTSGELAYYLCAGPAGLPLVALVRVAGPAGGWWSRSRPARGCAAWTDIRSAVGTPGTDG